MVKDKIKMVAVLDGSKKRLAEVEIDVNAISEEFNRQSRFKNKMNKAYQYGYEVGRSPKRNRNKCKYGHFLLREKWFQGFEKGLKD